MNFVIKIEPEAVQDIQDVIYWYEVQQSGLGKQFYREVELAIGRLQQNPFYQVRYRNVRCLPLTKYPFMIHYTIDETNSIVIIRAIFNTSLNPKRWLGRR